MSLQESGVLALATASFAGGAVSLVMGKPVRSVLFGILAALLIFFFLWGATSIGGDNDSTLPTFVGPTSTVVPPS